MKDLQRSIEQLYQLPASELPASEAREALEALLVGLESGEIRSAERSETGAWSANAWVKQGILVGFRLGQLESSDSSLGRFVDKDTFPVRRLVKEDGVRIVPGGTSIRRGAHVGRGVICMPPAYINVGAFVDQETVVDSHALIGSCAQIGARVHVSAAAQIGGVLEPVGSRPVIVEDGAFVGGNGGVYGGCIIRKGAVLAAGVILTGSSRVYDVVNERVLTAGEEGLEIPEGAVVVPGSRPVDSDFGREHGLSVSSPVIVKYRDEKTDASVALEDALR